jgi:excinuclease ABC subunit C
VGEAVRELNDVVMLRDCRTDLKMFFSDQTELFQLSRTPGCIRYEIDKCLGPCVGGCSAAQYDERVALARAFLDGADDGPLEVLRVKMERLSEEMEFERAAHYRDKLQRLEALRAQFGRLRFAVENLSFMYTVPGHEGQDRVYLIRRGVVRAEVVKPRSPKDRRTMKQLVEDIFSRPETPTAQVPTHEIDELLLLSSWFRRFPQEMRRTKQVS